MQNIEKKRIMLIVPMLDQGGLERVCALTAQLLKNIHEVHLVVFNTEGMIYDVTGVHVIDLQLGAVPGKIGKIKNLITRVKRLKQLKKQYDIQISYSLGQTANLANVLSKRQDKTWAGIRGYGALDDKLNMRLVCKLADKVISCTKVMEQDIEDMYGTKSSVTLYNPCDLEEIERLSNMSIGHTYQEFLDKPGMTVVSVGRAHDVKGFWHLIKSVYLVKQNGNQVKLMIIGAGDFSEYEKLAERLGMREDVLFTGVQKNPFALMKRADVYALTSDSEGFPNALIEAMAVGLPCVSVNCKTGPAEILQEEYKECEDQNKIYQCDYGILVSVFCGEKDLNEKSFTEEEKVFAQELEAMLNQDKKRLYGQKAKIRAQQFSNEAYMNYICKMIDEERCK